MTKENQIERIGFTCAYAPLPIIEAAGFAHYRVLPLGSPPEQAGSLLHDNLCAHVKRVLDRAIAGDLPELAGVILVNSCDAMRRLADAWEAARPGERVVRMDLPATPDALSETYLAGEMERVATEIFSWKGEGVDPGRIEKSIARYDQLAGRIEEVKKRIRGPGIEGGAAAMQELYNRAATEPLSDIMSHIDKLLGEPAPEASAEEGVPIFLFGNVLPDPEAFTDFESCGAWIVDDDLCTGARLFSKIDVEPGGNVFHHLARRALQQPRCARTFDPAQPEKMAEDILARAKASGARGVIGHILKFCDPYLARLPMVRDALKTAGIPLLLIEGDCTTRSMGQQRTRIEAFIEMLR